MAVVEVQQFSIFYLQAFTVKSKGFACVRASQNLSPNRGVFTGCLITRRVVFKDAIAFKLLFIAACDQIKQQSTI